MSEPLKVVDGCALAEEHRSLLRPGEAATDGLGRVHHLPRFFYMVESWTQARETKLTPHFTLSELTSVDCREAEPLLRRFPHYVPCAISILARYLEEFRSRVEAPVFVTVNGGYRSPSHQFSRTASPHLWGAAADIYRIGDTWLDDSRSIDRYGKIAETIGQEVFVKSFGSEPGATDDHLHFDLGFLHSIPAFSNEEQCR